MKQTLYSCVFSVYSFCTILGQNIHAQQLTSSDVEREVREIVCKAAPGVTVTPENTEGWTDEMFRQWEEAVRKANNEKNEKKPVIETPDFTNMTDEQISAWEDSVLNVNMEELFCANTTFHTLNQGNNI